MDYQIEFEPVGRRGKCSAGQTLLDCARYLGVDLVSICGGLGKCKSCRVQVLNGKVSAISPIELTVFSTEQLQSGWRLACLAKPEGDCTIHVPPESLSSLQRMQTEGLSGLVNPDPAVHSFQIELPPPSFTDLRSDATRILNTLDKNFHIHCKNIDIKALQILSPDLRSWNWQAAASVRKDEVIALNPVGSRQLGLAVDLGTTKVAAYLMDLETGETIASKGLMNPQISYGEDITSRMHHALKIAGGASRLQDLVVTGINQLAVELSQQAGAQVTDIIDSVIVGNTAMHHLLLGLSVNPLSYPPFVAAVQDSLDIKAKDIGLQLSPGTYVHLLPNIAGFVGADHVAMLLGIKDFIAPGLTLALDIGTNTEVSLINKKSITCVSCASGPAFEGGHISCGMRAAAGAIERLRIEDGSIEYLTIDGAPPTGICGSGIIDAVAQMYLAGILDHSGRIREKHPGVQSSDKGLHFVLSGNQDGRPPVTVSQRDIREIQLAKAAIRTGIQVLLDTAGRSEKEIERIIIAGAFGTYIDIESAITIGMLPVLPIGSFQQVGNAAGMGSRQALISIKKRHQAKLIAKRMRYIELASAPGFNHLFIQTQYLGKYYLINGRREPIS